MQQVVVHLKQKPKNFLATVLHARIREGMWDRFKQYEHCLPLHLQYEDFEALQNSCLLHRESLNIVATLRENPSIDNNLELLQKEFDHYMPKAPHEIAMPAHMREGYVPQLHLFVQAKLKETSRAFTIQPELAIDRVDALRILEMSGTLLWPHVCALQRRTALMDHKEANAYLNAEEKMAQNTRDFLEKIKDTTYSVERLDNGGVRIIKRDAFFQAALDKFYDAYIALNETQPCNDPACREREETK
jgi:hypothetical protein